MSGTRLVDEILKKSSTTPERPIREKYYTTLHNRDVTSEEFYLVARFIVALIDVIVPKNKIPLLLDIGTHDLRLPVWRKTGGGWVLANYEIFTKEAYGLPVPMMRAISRKLSLGENQILNALHSLSMIGVDIITNPMEGPRRYRQNLNGILVNPVDGQPLSTTQVQNIEGFKLDKKRIQQWVHKELQKRGNNRT